MALGAKLLFKATPQLPITQGAWTLQGPWGPWTGKPVSPVLLPSHTWCPILDSAHISCVWLWCELGPRIPPTSPPT